MGSCGAKSMKRFGTRFSPLLFERWRMPHRPTPDKTKSRGEPRGPERHTVYEAQSAGRGRQGFFRAALLKKKLKSHDLQGLRQFFPRIIIDGETWRSDNFIISPDFFSLWSGRNKNYRPGTWNCFNSCESLVPGIQMRSERGDSEGALWAYPTCDMKITEHTWRVMP